MELGPVTPTESDRGCSGSRTFGDSIEGAFTGARRGGRVGLVEAADSGTLFLDEIGELPLPLQTRLLRVLEEREVLRVGATEPVAVDVRVVAATLQDLESQVEAGRFRRDLYYRLAALRIALPALREHPQDVPILLDHFFAQLGQRASPLDAASREHLRAYPWPGNVRELRNLVDRLRIHWPASAGSLPLPQLLAWAPELRAAPRRPAADTRPGPAMRRPSTQTLHQLMAECEGNREAVAARLGVSRTTLWRWLRGGALDTGD